MSRLEYALLRISNINIILIWALCLVVGTQEYKDKQIIILTISIDPGKTILNIDK